MASPHPRYRTLKRLALLAALGLGLLLALGIFASWYFSFEARFARSKPALDAYAAKVIASDPAKPLPLPPSHLGSFTTGRAERLPHGFLFFCDYGHPLDANGLAYSTDPLPPRMNERDYFTHIEGNWYMLWRN